MKKFDKISTLSAVAALTIALSACTTVDDTVGVTEVNKNLSKKSKDDKLLSLLIDKKKELEENVKTTNREVQFAVIREYALSKTSDELNKEIENNRSNIKQNEGTIKKNKDELQKKKIELAGFNVKQLQKTVSEIESTEKALHENNLKHEKYKSAWETMNNGAEEEDTIRDLNDLFLVVEKPIDNVKITDDQQYYDAENLVEHYNNAVKSYQAKLDDLTKDEPVEQLEKANKLEKEIKNLEKKISKSQNDNEMLTKVNKIIEDTIKEVDGKTLEELAVLKEMAEKNKKEKEEKYGQAVKVANVLVDSASALIDGIGKESIDTKEIVMGQSVNTLRFAGLPFVMKSVGSFNTSAGQLANFDSLFAMHLNNSVVGIAHTRRGISMNNTVAGYEAFAKASFGDLTVGIQGITSSLSADNVNVASAIGSKFTMALDAGSLTPFASFKMMSVKFDSTKFGSELASSAASFTEALVGVRTNISQINFDNGMSFNFDVSAAAGHETITTMGQSESAFATKISANAMLSLSNTTSFIGGVSFNRGLKTETKASFGVNISY